MPFTKFADYFNTSSKNSESTESTECKNSNGSEAVNQPMDDANLETTVTNTGKELDHSKTHHRHITDETFHQSSDNLIVGL